jgi:serine/threonine protein kinase
MTVSAEESRVGIAFGKYTITGVLGKGGMGEVYEAHDNEIGRTVALKIIKSQFADDRKYRIRFERESHAAAKLQEPHIIPIHGYGEIDGCLFIDMRLVRGTDLQSMIDTAPLEPSRAVAIIAQIAAALDAAHAEGLIHRDIKPQNIIVTPADFAYLVDFGIAEVIGDTRLTAAGAQVGSFAYMAPERFGGQEITPAIDIYALTCVLYEALTGRMPFEVDTPEAVVAAHLAYPPPRPSVTNPDVPAAFDDVVARGMAKEPDDRYGSAGALGRAANRALKGVGGTSLDSTGPVWPRRSSERPPERPRDRTRWLVPTVIAVSGALVLGAIGVVIVLLAKLNTHAPGPAPTAAPTTSVSSIAGLPPLVAGPDQSISHTICDQGFQVGSGTGFGTHAGRGSAGTSCFFANSVMLAYWNAYGNASTAQRSVSAQGAVPCDTVAGAICDPRNTANFLMHCAQDGSDPWIKCTGGNHAVVYLW